MKVSIDSEAMEYIKANNSKSITLFFTEVSPWGASRPNPSVKIGKPQNINDFNKLENEDITVYVKSGIKAENDSLKVKYAKMLWMEKLIVEGMIF